LAIAERGKPNLSPRECLRAATRGAHSKADHLFGCFDLADPEAYRRLLAVHQAVVPFCETILEASGVDALISDWPSRTRAAALAEDLAIIGAGSGSALGLASQVDAPAAFGMLYVLEGSRLGGAVLIRRLEANPDVNCRSAMHYFGHGEGLNLWPSFVVAFDKSPDVLGNYEAVVSSALETFELFICAARASLGARGIDHAFS
jgi:heme oxygenase